jgi:hypothetical protein
MAAAAGKIRGPQRRVLVTGVEIRVTIEPMQLALLGMRVLEAMFFLGLVGSAIVIIISFVEDGKELFSKEE